MKTICRALVLLFLVCGAASAQVAPEVTGSGGLPLGKNLTYALRYAQAAQFGTSLPTIQTSTASGSFNYLSGNDRHPSTFDYSGGYTWSLNGPTYGTGQFQRLFISQGADWRTWKFMASDDASYLPQSPTTGFSGIPGIGEPIGGIPVTPPSGQSILTLNTHTIENIGIVHLGHDLNGATTITASGTSGLLRYPNGDGLDTDTVVGEGSLVRELNGRNSISGQYLYSRFSYPGFTVHFQTNTGLFGYQHKWTRSVGSYISVGPQWISSSITSIVPNSTDVAVNANLTYLMRLNTFSVAYTRGTNGGAGYLTGAELDTVTGNFSREFGRNFSLGVSGGYDRTAGLNNNGATGGYFGASEGVWRLGKDLIIFANYTGMGQGTTSPLPTNALNQRLQTISFGVGLSPRAQRQAR